MQAASKQASVTYYNVKNSVKQILFYLYNKGTNLIVNWAVLCSLPNLVYDQRPQREESPETVAIRKPNNHRNHLVEQRHYSSI